MCDLEIAIIVYKSNMTVMSFQRKINVDVWSPWQLQILSQASSLEVTPIRH